MSSDDVISPRQLLAALDEVRQAAEVAVREIKAMPEQEAVDHLVALLNAVQRSSTANVLGVVSEHLALLHQLLVPKETLQ